MATESKIGIVGTGLIGAGWAAFFAAKEMRVDMFDASAEAARAGHALARSYINALSAHGLFGLADADQRDLAVRRLMLCDTLAEAVADAALVQESVSERYEIKQDVLWQIDLAAPPETIIASSSSGLLMSELQTAMARPERSLIAHPFNPPHLIPLVELVPGNRTAPETLTRAKAFYESLGKTAVVLAREIPGHIANRLQAAVWREAVHLVLSGVASVADVDRAITAGPGLRWALLGPNAIFHLGGGPGGIRHFLEHIGVSFDRLWSDMAAWTTLPEGTADALARGMQEQLGDRSAEDLARWRDEKLVALLKAISGD